MVTRHEYGTQARTYDRTRAASESIVAPLRDALADAPGPRLADVGGGTGNYATAMRDLNFEPLVLDHSAAMLAVAVSKGLPVVQADAAALPLASASFDAVMFVSMLHHVPGWSEALDEGRRVLRPGGRLAVVAFAREHLAVHWVMDYFPATAAYFRDAHQPLAQLLGALPGSQVRPVYYRDVVDGSMAALCRYPDLLLDDNFRRQTSFFERAAADHPEELDVGITRLAADLAAGQRPQDRNIELRQRLGDAALVSWTAPPATQRSPS